MFIEEIAGLGSFLFLSVALAMDAFSVSLSIGLQNIRLKKIVIIGFVIGLFHVVLPFIGMVIGSFFSFKLEQMANVLGGFILIFLGLHIFFSSFRLQANQKINLTWIKLLVVSFGVSIDSLPVGISLGLSNIDVFFVFILFGLTSMVFSWIGLLLGKKTNAQLGKYGEIFGGVILFLLGILIIF